MSCPTSSRLGLLSHTACLTLGAFAAHLVWEVVQCPIFFVHGTYDGGWRGMMAATLGDVGITWLIYATVAVVSKRWRWDTRPWRLLQWATLIVAAVVIGVAVEMRGLTAGKWSYTSAMPVIPGLAVGLLPLVQLLVLTPALIWLAARPLGAWRTGRL